MGNDLRKQLEDLREQNKKLKAALIRAYKDNLTGLWNRNFFEKFKKKLENTKSPIGIIFIDANKLKFVNDSYGHEIGDQYLKDIGELILKTTQRKSDFAFRIGGDEFIIILVLTGDNPENGLNIVLDRLNKNLKKLNEGRLEKNQVEISIAIGSKIKNDGTPLFKCISNAEELMYEHKAFQKKQDPSLER